MEDLIKCASCNKPYRFDRLRECPGCGETTPRNYQRAAELSIIEPSSQEFNQSLFGKFQKTNNGLIRSLAIAFLAYLGTGVAGSTLTWVGLFSRNSVLLNLGPILVILGFITAMVLCIVVIRKSS